MRYLRIDLKICEGCGALWLRATESAYCRGCVARLQEYPVQAPGKFRNKRRAKCKSGTTGTKDSLGGTR